MCLKLLSAYSNCIALSSALVGGLVFFRLNSQEGEKGKKCLKIFSGVVFTASFGFLGLQAGRASRILEEITEPLSGMDKVTRFVKIFWSLEFPFSRNVTPLICPPIHI